MNYKIDKNMIIFLIYLTQYNNLLLIIKFSINYFRKLYHMIITIYMQHKPQKNRYVILH